LPDHPDIPLEYRELVGQERMGIRQIAVGKVGKTYDIATLLDGIEPAEIRRDAAWSQSDGGREGIGDIHIEISPTISPEIRNQVDVRTHQVTHLNFDLRVELPGLRSEFDQLRDTLAPLHPQLQRELDKIENSLDDVSATSEPEKLNRPFNQLGRLLGKLADDKSDLRKAVRGTGEAVRIAQRVGKTYNKFAQWLALPQVPDLFLG
jgi:hypothetical protein